MFISIHLYKVFTNKIFVKTSQFSTYSFAILAFLLRTQNQKNLSALCVRKKSTKHDKQDTANAPFHNKQNVCKSIPTALQGFLQMLHQFVF